MSFASVTVALLLCLSVIPALGQNTYSGPMRFLVIRPCTGSDPSCDSQILAEGVIQPDTPTKFAAFLSNTEAYLPRTVCFNSTGGNLNGGLELGLSIRRRGLDTCLSSEYSDVTIDTEPTDKTWENAVCASACTFAFVGGVSRRIEDGAQYGIHQFSNPEKDQGDSATQMAVTILARYLEDMGVNRTLLDVASRVEPSKMKWLSQEELQTLRVDNMSDAKIQWQLKALEDGTVTAEITQMKQESRTQVLLTIVKHEGRPVLMIKFTPNKEDYKGNLGEVLEVLNRHQASADWRKASEVLESMYGLELEVDGTIIKKYMDIKWKAISPETVAITLPLSGQEVDALRKGKELEFSIFVSNAERDYDPSLGGWPLDDHLRRLLRAVLK